MRVAKQPEGKWADAFSQRVCGVYGVYGVHGVYGVYGVYGVCGVCGAQIKDLY